MSSRGYPGTGKRFAMKPKNYDQNADHALACGNAKDFSRALSG